MSEHKWPEPTSHILPNDNSELQCLIDARAELTRLRGIEAAVRGHDDEAPLEVIIASWRHLALQMRSDGMSAWPLILEGIADELKVK